MRLSGVKEEGSGSRVAININYLFRKKPAIATINIKGTKGVQCKQ